MTCGMYVGSRYIRVLMEENMLIEANNIGSEYEGEMFTRPYLDGGSI